MRFQTPLALAGGCSERICSAKWTLNRQKSISSQAASISAWYAVFDWPSIVAALRVERHGPDSSSAALRKTAARSSNGSSRQPGAAAFAAATASAASAFVASRVVPSTRRWACGWRTAIRAPRPIRCRPPIVMVRSSRSDCSSARRTSRAARSGLPGA